MRNSFKRNLKNKLNDEFERIVPNLSYEARSAPIIKGYTKRANTLKLSLFMRATAFLMVFVMLTSVLIFTDTKKVSSVTCYILYFSAGVQIVEKNDSIISIDALDEDAEALVKNIDISKNNSLVASIESIINLACEMGFVKESDTILLKVINNSSSEAVNRIAIINSCVSPKVKNEYRINIHAKTISFEEYNDIAFDGVEVVDNLDEDIDYIVNVGNN